MMRWLLLASLMFSCNLLAARLQTNATADTYLYDQASVAGTAGSFTIWPSTAALVAMTGMNSTASPDRTNTNYETQATQIVGFSSGYEFKALLRFETLADSMRTKATGKLIRWDSAVVVIIPQTSIDSTTGARDSVTFAIYELRSARRFVESQATWNSYATASSWTTPGGTNTSSDIHSPQLDTTVTLTKGMTVANDTTNLWCRFKIPGANVSDTINNAGVMIAGYRYGVDDGAISRIVFHTDDATTAAYRPRLTVYYTEMEYPDFGGADTLLAKVTIPETQKCFPVMTFDISSVTATATLANCSVYVYVNASYSDNSEGTIGNSMGIAMKPINIGTGTGGATATGKLHWGAWFENGATDSTWGAIGANDNGYVCNRSSGSGDDKTTDTSFASNILSGTGWRSVAIDTMAVRAYLNGTCSNFAVILEPTASVTDDAWYVLSSVEGANDPYLVINYTPGAVTATVGTGRFGRSQTGEYLNVR